MAEERQAMDEPARKPKRQLPSLEKFEAIADVPVVLQAEIDRHTISLRKLLELGVGDILSLPKPTGENISLYLGDTQIGWAEVLVVEGVTAVRIADMCEIDTDSHESAHTNRKSANTE
jgi:flagellar motor switch/type III secretory pathway protein FliN